MYILFHIRISARVTERETHRFMFRKRFPFPRTGGLADGWTVGQADRRTGGLHLFFSTQLNTFRNAKTEQQTHSPSTRYEYTTICQPGRQTIWQQADKMKAARESFISTRIFCCCCVAEIGTSI